MYAEFPTILTTIALNVLKKAGVHRSLVFCPVSILLSLWKQPDFASSIFQGVASLNSSFWSENSDVILANNVTSYTLDWTLSLNESRTKPFQIDDNNFKSLNFLMMNRKENMYLSCDEASARRARDEYFDVLEIPLQKNRRFVAFLPNASISESLEKLDVTRFHDLTIKLSHEFIHFEIPTFELHSNISTIKELESTFHLKFNFEIPTVPLRQEPGPRFVLRVCETVPYFLELNRPFLFSVLNGNVTMVMGVFNGIE